MQTGPGNCLALFAFANETHHQRLRNHAICRLAVIQRFDADRIDSTFPSDVLMRSRTGSPTGTVAVASAPPNAQLGATAVPAARAGWFSVGATRRASASTAGSRSTAIDDFKA
jgi:hypothetical protein